MLESRVLGLNYPDIIYKCPFRNVQAMRQAFCNVNLILGPKLTVPKRNGLEWFARHKKKSAKKR